jgi:TPP-dependent pyruvate/acetoin dehydrogenase alpha subunit
VLTTKDPLPKFQESLMRTGILTETVMKQIEDDVHRQVDEAVATVNAAPLLAPEAALQDLYA